MTLNNYQVDLEDLDNNLREAKKMCKFLQTTFLN